MRKRVTWIGSLAMLLVLSGTAPSAQGIPRKSLEDQVLGWIKVYDYKGATQPITLDRRVYSPAQLSIAYFFDPGKVKGQPYKPLRSPSAVEAAAVVAPSEAAKKHAADPAVHFFEDFSSGVVGKKPLNWRSTLDNAGASSVVTELKGLDGHWASMGGYALTPTQLKGPLPADFEVSYDVVAAQNYRWGAKGLTFKLSRTPAAGGGTSFLSVKIRPGSGGGDGEVAIEGQFPGAQGYMSGTKWVVAPGFSNNLVINRAIVTLKKKGDLLQVFVGPTKIAEYEKGIPPGLQFDALSFELTGNAANEQMCIGNIRITKN